MSITYDANTKRFHLYNHAISYVMEVSAYGDLLHVYYGARLDAHELSPVRIGRSGFSATEPGDWLYSLDVLPQEYPAYGSPDLRTPAYQVQTADGHRISALQYVSHTISRGKPGIPGLPAAFVEKEDEADTLEVVLEDARIGLAVSLFYTIYAERNVVCRWVKFTNNGSADLRLTRALSMCLDLPAGSYEYIHLHGAWARERHWEQLPVGRGMQGIESRRGASGSTENPFLAVLSQGAGEDYGEVIGLSLVYSGNFQMQLEGEQYGTVRVLAGISPFDFGWTLAPGESFHTPEALLVYSSCGLSGMSHTFHALLRDRLCTSKFGDLPRPVLINSWEAAYFDFDESKLLAIADQAKELGMELLVLDDGWFGKRNDDTSSLGDWNVNYEKLPGGLKQLADRVNERGLQFGLWVEPEMISPDSDLYRAHPDWALGVAGAKSHEGRNQLILDLTRADVRAYLVNTFTDIFASANIAYVKWDMNRNMTEAGSRLLAANQQTEVAHRYILGLYEIVDTLTKRFPDILFEGCSGGGGRFDPGMLYYMPQMWASDDTDAVERAMIQYATSLVYPASCVCAQVSAVPNHQVGRTTPLTTRGNVAMSGMMGYTMDLSQLTADEKETIKEQIVQYKSLRHLPLCGTYHRLCDPFRQGLGAWMFVSPDRKEAMVVYCRKLAAPNAPLMRLRCKGLDGDRIYVVDGESYSGATLMHYGLPIPPYQADFDSKLWHITAKENCDEI